jgi:hypothetical protein
MPRSSVKSAELDEGWQLLHARNVDENASPSREFFAFALTGADVEKLVGQVTKGGCHVIDRIR